MAAATRSERRCPSVWSFSTSARRAVRLSVCRPCMSSAGSSHTTGARTKMVHNGVTMETADTRITVRLPADVADALRDRATVDHRSLNRQIVFLLRQALFPPVDADAYRDSRGSLSSMPRYTHPRPLSRRPRGDANG